METEFFIGFCKGKLWLTRFLNREISHCYVLMRGDKYWMKIDPSWPRPVLYVLPMSAETNVPKLIMRTEPTHRFIRIRHAFDNRKLMMPTFGMITCVSIVRYICGLRFFAFTPKSLYRKLLNYTDSQMFRDRINSITVIF